MPSTPPIWDRATEATLFRGRQIDSPQVIEAIPSRLLGRDISPSLTMEFPLSRPYSLPPGSQRWISTLTEDSPLLNFPAIIGSVRRGIRYTPLLSHSRVRPKPKWYWPCQRCDSRRHLSLGK